MVSFCVSGLQNTLPFDIKGVKTYGASSQGGNLGMLDLPVIKQLEDVDLFIMNFDAWAVSDVVRQFDFPLAFYPPVDHDPLPKNWKDVLVEADKIVPYCKFGERVIEEWIETDDRVEKDLLYEKGPIYHGIDTKTYQPREARKEEIFGVDEDTFVVGIFKNNQGTRWKPVRQLRAFKMFLQEIGDGDAFMYLHSSIQGRNAFNLSYMIPRLDLEDEVKLVDQGQYRWGLPEEHLSVLYSSCDILLNCTAGEGFGLPIVEAFACGIPAVASGFSAMPELLSGEEGEIDYQDVEEPFVETERGFLVPVWDAEPTLGKHSWRRTVRAEHIRDTLLYAYENREELRKKGKKARKWVIDYDWEQVAKKWYEFLDSYESEFFKEDESGIEWRKISEDKVRGGVGGWER